MVRVGESAQLQASLQRNNTAPEDATSRGQWSSTANAAVDLRGILTGVSPGPATVTFAFEGLTRQLVVTIAPR
jgi:hypothetical protein